MSAACRLASAALEAPFQRHFQQGGPFGASGAATVFSLLVLFSFQWKIGQAVLMFEPNRPSALTGLITGQGGQQCSVWHPGNLKTGRMSRLHNPRQRVKVRLGISETSAGTVWTVCAAQRPLVCHPWCRRHPHSLPYLPVVGQRFGPRWFRPRRLEVLKFRGLGQSGQMAEWVLSLLQDVPGKTQGLSIKEPAEATHVSN